MKTSNYILITIFILVIASILTLYITSKRHESFSVHRTEISLPNTIHVIVAESNTNIIVNGNDKNSILLDDQIKEQEVYRISADTLFLNVTKYSPIILLNHSVSIIGQENNMITISDYKANKLTVQKTGGNLWMSSNVIDTLQIKATDRATVFLLDKNQIDYLSADMKNGSSFNFTKYNKIGKLNVEGIVPNIND